MRYRVPSRHPRRARNGGPRDARVSIPGGFFIEDWSLIPGTATGSQAALVYDPPAGWTLDLNDDFTGTSLVGANWLNRSFSGGAHCAGDAGCAAQWDGGAGLSVTGGNLRMAVTKNGASWLVTGLMQGGGTQFNFHPGYGEFHVRFRARFTSAHAPGIGWYGLMWPWPNQWSTELDIVETPGADKTRSDGTLHWDNAINNYQVTGSFNGPDLSQFNTWDCRRTYTFLNGRKVAKIEIWFNGQPLRQADGTPYAEVEQNLFMVEPMMLGFATYVRCPVYCIDWYSDVDATTPSQAFAEIDFARIWRPEPAVAAQQVARVDILLRGADSAAAMVSAGGATEIARVVRALTGIATVNVIASNTGNRTTHPGTATASVTSATPTAWLSGFGVVSSPVQWVEQSYLTQTKAALAAGMSTNPAHPLLDVALHWEADLATTNATEQLAYAAGRSELNRRFFTAAGKAAGKYVTFDAYCPATAGVQAAQIANIGTTWANQVYQSGTREALALGQAQDCTASGAVWTAAGALQAATRIGIRLARYCFEQGWTANDLAALPGLGMNIGGLKRESDPTVLTVFVQHDRGSDIVIPLGVNPAVFEVTDGTTTRTGVAIKYRTTQSISVTFNGAVPTSAATVLRHCWTPGFIAPGTLVTDNFHTSDVYKPGVIGSTSGVGTMTLPLQRSLVTVPLDAAGPDTQPTRNPVFSNNIANAVLGATTQVLVTGLIPNEPFEWTVVQTDANYTWRTDPPFTGTASASGQATLPAVFVATNDFTKLLFDSRAVSYDSVRVTTIPSSGGGGGTIPTGDAAFAFAFRDSLRHSIDLERFRGNYFTYNGTWIGANRNYWDYLRNLGIDNVRSFYGWHNTNDMAGDGVTISSGRRPTEAKVRQWLATYQMAAASGMKVSLDFVDVCSWDVLQDQWANVSAHLDMCAQIVSTMPELSPTMCQIGPYNELIKWNSTNVQYNQLRMDAHNIIRNRLSSHIIQHGANDWNLFQSLTDSDWQPPPDKRSCGRWHGYVGYNFGRAGWSDVQANYMTPFEARHGIPTWAGEVGDDFDHSNLNNDPNNLTRWVDIVRQYADAAPKQKGAMWAITDGSEYPLSRGGADGRLLPVLEAVYLETKGLMVTT